MFSYVPTLLNLIFRPLSLLEYVDDRSYKKHWSFMLASTAVFILGLNAWLDRVPIEENVALKWLRDHIVEYFLAVGTLIVYFGGIFIVAAENDKYDFEDTARLYFKMSCLICGLMMSLFGLGMLGLHTAWKLGYIGNPVVSGGMPDWLRVALIAAAAIYFTFAQMMFWEKDLWATLSIMFQGIIVGSIIAAVFMLVVYLPVWWILLRVFGINL